MADPAFHFLAKPAPLQLANQGSEAIRRAAPHYGTQQIAKTAASALARLIAHRHLSENPNNIKRFLLFVKVSRPQSSDITA
jgi:hypothetical protein